MTIRMRQFVERQIASALIDAALAAGYEIDVHDPDEAPVPTGDRAEILRRMFQSDEDHLRFSRGGLPAGSAYFVWSNDGYDCLSDYSTNLEPIVGEANRLADYWSGHGEFVSYEEFCATVSPRS